MKALNFFFAQNTGMGALPTLYAATAPAVKGSDHYRHSGFMETKGYPIKVSSIPLAQDLKIAEKLWAASEELTGVKYPKSE